MSTTTTIRLSDELKERVAAAAERAGTTPHGFILEAIAEKTEQAERRADFHAEATRRDAAIAGTGLTIPWSELRKHLEARAAGRKTRRPVARKMAR